MTISHLPALFSPPTAPPPTPSRPFRPLLRRALAPTRRGRPPLPPVASRWPSSSLATRPVASRTTPPAATAPPPWNGRCRARRPLLASARALHISQASILCIPLLYPRYHAAEHRRRPAGTP